MNLNSKTIISTFLILLCGICVDGHAKSKKHKDKNKNKHTETYVKPTAVKPKIQEPITQVKVKEVVIETPKVKIEQPVPVEEVVVITYQPNHEEKIGKEVEEVKQEEISQEIVVDNMCESEALEEHIAENSAESLESNI